MNNRSKFSELLNSFCICTTCITILEGILGVFFFPNERFGYEAFFSPPVFAVLSVLLGVVTWSKKELTVRQVLLRRVLHLILIEVMVFGANYFSGAVFETEVNITLAIGIAVVFVMVYVLLWISDQKSAVEFNQKLKEYQKKQG